jgi:protein SCO1/2
VTRSMLSIAALLLLGGAGAMTRHSGDTGLPFYLDASRTPVWIAPDAPEYSTIHTVPDFSLIDQEGRIVSPATTAGKIYVASFFFTACRELCPKLQSNLARVQQAFRDDSNVMILTHSVTPGADDSATLRRYGRANNINSSRWRLLTGSPDLIRSLARDGYFAALPDTIDGVAKPLLHTETLVLVDAMRRIRGVYDGSLQYDVERLIADIQALR